VLLAQGDLAGALAAYGESLAVAQRLAAADSSNAGWQRDLSFVLTRIAESHERQRNRTEALRCAEESLEIDQQLAALNPANATWQRDVAASCVLVARLRGVAGEGDELG
jgi:tetratricopeptide (TPR) repeat protein